MENKLVKFINQELKARGWSYRKLSRLSGVSHSHISNVLNEQAPVSWDFCEAMAKIFDASVWDFATAAGLTGSVPDYVKDQEQINILINIYQKLSPVGKRQLISLAKWVSTEDAVNWGGGDGLDVEDLFEPKD